MPLLMLLLFGNWQHVKELLSYSMIKARIIAVKRDIRACGRFELSHVFYYSRYTAQNNKSGRTAKTVSIMRPLPGPPAKDRSLFLIFLFTSFPCKERGSFSSMSKMRSRHRRIRRDSLYTTTGWSFFMLKLRKTTGLCIQVLSFLRQTAIKTLPQIHSD